MSEQSSTSASLPENPNLDWLRKQAKRRLDELRATDPSAQLAGAQFELAKQYGFASWRALKAHIDALGLDGQLFAAAENGDTTELAALLDAHPEKLHVRKPPYEWSLLHVAAHKGQLAAVDLLLQRGLDANTRETGDNTYAMHWAAAAGHLDVVRRLADAGGDVVGRGDDHELEVIGWATCWQGTDTPAHRAVVDFLISRGARHHIFSAIALNDANEVRRIVAAYPAALSSRQSRNEDHRTPLHFAIEMKRPEMVALLVELGADPLAPDGSGFPAGAYASGTDVDRALMEKIHSLTLAELDSARRGQRSARALPMDVVASLSLGNRDIAELLLRDNPQLLVGGGAQSGVLHMIAKRGDVEALKWLLARGADPNALWDLGDARVTPLHLASWAGHPPVTRALLEAGADPSIRDSKHDSDALGWAEFFDEVTQPPRPEFRQIVEIVKAHAARS